MYKIDIHNYEAYLLDFSEGNLTDEAQLELELFLIQHPELDINLSELAVFALEEESVMFANKSHLKKSSSDLVSETQFISYIENQLPINELLHVEKSCALNPTLLSELSLYKHTIAIPDTSIAFSNKAQLKRKPAVIWFNFSVTQYAAAASVLFLIGLYMFWPKPETNVEDLTLTNNSTQLSTTHTNLNSIATNSSLQNNTTTIVSTQQTNTTIQQQIPAIKKQQLAANNTTIQSHQNTLLNDSSNTPISNPITLVKPKDELLLATNTLPKETSSLNTVVETIIENDDEPVAVNTSKQKTGIWAKASKALQNLNQVGVKSVNGEEEITRKKTAYAITLGGLSITHNTAL